MSYQGPIGKAQVLESFKHLTAPFIILDYTDPFFEKQAMGFIMDTHDPSGRSFGDDYLLRSAGTFEGLLPQYFDEYNCWVGRTFAGLMDSPSFHICDDSQYDETCDLIERLKHQTASRFIQAGGGSHLERELFEKYESSLDSSQLDNTGNHGELVRILKEYSQRRKVNLSQHNMRFILQRRVPGRLVHVMRHPNFQDMCYIERQGSFYDSSDKQAMTKEAPILFPLNDKYRRKIMSFKSQFSELENKIRSSRKLTQVYSEVIKNLHPEIVYLVECIENEEGVVPVQATPVFRRFPREFELKPIDVRSYRFLLSQTYSPEDIVQSPYIREDGRVIINPRLNLTGKVLQEVPIPLLDHISIREIEGVKAAGIGVEQHIELKPSP